MGGSKKTDTVGDKPVAECVVLPSLRTLSRHCWPAGMFKEWKKNISRATDGEVMQRFVDYNRTYLDFLGIQTNILAGGVGLELITSSYIGVIPLRAPDTGNIVTSVAVDGRYGEQPQELMSVLESSIRPEYNTEWPMATECPISPPVFMECCAYIDLFLKAEQSPWRKFASEVVSSHQPSGSTLWEEYALRTASNPCSRSDFRNRKNLLTEEHPERQMLNYVCALALEKLAGPRVPQTTRVLYGQKCAQAQRILTRRGSLPTDAIPIHASDPVIIRQLKELAEAILADKSNARYAWRLDYSNFFERYVQYLFQQASRPLGATVDCNPHYVIHTRSHRPAWGLAYLEPDLILHSRSANIVVDAKYKSHIYNYDDVTDQLHDSFRHDLHQIVAYTALTDGSPSKAAILVYPASSFRHERLNIEGLTASGGNLLGINCLLELNLYLIGVPISAQQLPDTISSLQSLLSEITTE